MANAEICFKQALDHLYEKNDEQGAQTYFSKAIELNPDYFEAYAERGNALRLAGYFEDALKDVDRSLAIKENPIAYYIKTRVLMALQRTEEADNCLKMARDISLENNPFSFFHKAAALDDVGQKEQALQVFNKVLELKPDFADALYQKGEILGDLGRDKEAIQAYDEALNLKPTSATIYSQKGKILDSLGQDLLALACFNQAADLIEKDAIDSIQVKGNINYVNQMLNLQKKEIIQKVKALKDLTVETAKIAEKLDTSDKTIAKHVEVFSTLKEVKTILTQKLLDNRVNSDEKTKLLAQIGELENQLIGMQKILLELQNIQSSHEKRIAAVESILEDGGVYARAEIIRGFKELEQKDPELHIYCKTFYWTTMNLFGAYRNLSTNLVQGKIGHDEWLEEKVLVTGAQKMAHYGAEIVKGVPFVGGLIGALDHIIDDVYKIIKTNEFDNKVNAITKVIEKKFGLEDDISINVGRLALAVTQTKEHAILYPEIRSPTKTPKGLRWIQSKLDEVKHEVLSSVYLHDENSYAVTLALEDVALLIAYLCQNYEAVIRRKASLDKQFIDIITHGGLEQMFEDIGRNTLMEAENVKREACCCNLF